MSELKSYLLQGDAAAIPQRWIPVTESLPDFWVSVLVADAGDIESVGIGMRHEKSDRISRWLIAGRLEFPTHWMPLPQPPEISSLDQLRERIGEK